MSERAVRVARVSSGQQNELSQVPITTAWCNEHGYDVADERLILIHGKSAKSGAHMAELNRAVRMVETGVADVIVMVRLDRMSRQGLDAALSLRSRVKNAGGRWEFARQTRLNGNGVEADREWARRAIDAQEESELRMERIAEGYAETMANGSATGRPKFGWVLAGYTQAKRWEAADDKTVAVVNGIFWEVAHGTLRSAMDWARSQDSSIKFYLEHVRRMIGDRSYLGTVETRVNGQPYTFQVPALVSAELYAAANASLSAPKSYKPAAHTRFTGVLFCGCGGQMRRTSPNPNGTRYWACKACNARIRDDEAQSTAHTVLSMDGRQLYDEVLVRGADTRQVRIDSLNRELKNLSAKYGSDIDGLIQRAGDIKTELASVAAEDKPRGHVERKPTGQVLGTMYGLLCEHGADENSIATWLKSCNVRVVFLDRDGSCLVNAGITEEDV